MKLLNRLRNDFTGKTMVSILVKVFGAFATYVFLLVFANLLGAEDFGIFAFVLSAANFGMLAFGFGQPMLSLRNLSFAQSENDMATARGLLRFTLRVTALGMLVGAAAMVLFGQVAPLFGAPAGNMAYLAGALLLAVLVAAELFSHLLRALGSVAMALLPKDLLWRFLASLVVGVLIWAAIPIDAATALLLAALVLATLVVWQALFALRRAPAELRSGEASRSGEPEWRMSSLHFGGIALASGLVQHLVVVVVGFQADPADIGAFFAAFRTASLLAMPLTAANVVLAPMIARNYREGRLDRTQKAIRDFLVLSTLPLLVGVLVLLVWGDTILSLFQPEYASAHVALVIFACGSLFNTMTGPGGYMMMMVGREGLFLRYTTVSSIAAVIGAGVGVAYGMTWAAVLIVLAQAGQNLATAIWARRHTGVETTALCLVSTPAAQPKE